MNDNTQAVSAALALADAEDDINQRLAAVRLLNATAERGDEPVDLAAARILAAEVRRLLRRDGGQMTAKQIRKKYTRAMKFENEYFVTLSVDHQSFVIDTGGGSPTTKARAACFRTLLASALHRMAGKIDADARK